MKPGTNSSRQSKLWSCWSTWREQRGTTASRILWWHLRLRPSALWVHKLVENRKLILGGVEIPHETGLLGHSDADVLLHSISDALLGAAAMRDIGCLFPDNDMKYKDADSLFLLSEVVKAIAEDGWKIVNIDSIIVAQAPKLKPYIDTMRENIAKACGIDVSCVSVKATTEEGMGFTGSKDGMSSYAVCLIEK